MMSCVKQLHLFPDLYALIDALQLSPYSDYDTWEHLLLNPYLLEDPKPMYEFLSRVMWRTSKKAVVEQVRLAWSFTKN